MACWAVVLPIDVIKSKLQTQSMRYPEYSGILDCARKLYMREGLPAMYKGLLPCLVRAMPANGTAFLLYEQTSKALKAAAQ